MLSLVNRKYKGNKEELGLQLQVRDPEIFFCLEKSQCLLDQSGVLWAR